MLETEIVEAEVLLGKAKRYAEGTAVRINVESQDDIEMVKVLARAKLRN